MTGGLSVRQSTNSGTLTIENTNAISFNGNLITGASLAVYVMRLAALSAVLGCFPLFSTGNVVSPNSAFKLVSLAADAGATQLFEVPYRCFCD